mmetsp:Transcript_31606/g.61094  ORF Transcript_31606/g.61094 Transcript_31606/m.61094 type:complete len:85 (-) Transcript_31606:33-287(-)
MQADGICSLPDVTSATPCQMNSVWFQHLQRGIRRGQGFRAALAASLKSVMAPLQVASQIEPVPLDLYVGRLFQHTSIFQSPVHW